MAEAPTRARDEAAQDGSTTGSFRWLLVAGALLLQLAIGGVYAWSVIGGALEKADSWQLSKVEASLPFTVSVGMIFVGSYIGGRLQDRRGPRVVALAGGAIYAGGILLASFANGSGDYWMLIVG
jgi:OFA family oxalate/formate antiporter-like MFS transporter